MKKWITVLLFAGLLACSCPAGAQVTETQQLLLNVEKLAQLKSMLEDLKKGYDILYKGYQKIKNISEGNYRLHDAFLDGLLQVSPAVKNYRRVGDIITTQLQLVREYKSAYRQFQQSHLFKPGELSYVAGVYAKLFEKNQKNLEALATVLTQGSLRMSDAERLQAIDAIWKDVEDRITFLRHFNREAKVLLLQRVKDQAEHEKLKGLFSKDH